MNKLIISIFTLLMVAVGAMAQTATVTGTVTDDYGPVIGATVIVQGTTLGCTTDLDGKFTLTNVPDVNKAVLKISFVGMEEVKEPLKGRTSGINIHMTESASMLEDVVVIGYGTQKRGNLYLRTILISIRTSWKKSYVSIPKKSQKRTIRNVLISRSIPWER